MHDLADFRHSWNEQHKKLRQLLNKPEQHKTAIQLFLRQHAALHTSAMAQTGQETYADAIQGDMEVNQWRQIPHNSEHSIAWLVWHMARIEDVTMNLLIAGSTQLLHQDDWSSRLKVAFQDTGNAMTAVEIADLNATIDVAALLDYRVAIGRRTRDVVQGLPPEALKQKVNPTRLQQIMDEGAVAEASRSLLDYWAKRTIAGLLLMPPTRHNMVHLNEALKLKKRLS